MPRNSAYDRDNPPTATSRVLAEGELLTSTLPTRSTRWVLCSRL